MIDSAEIQVARRMAWERAKGELRSMIQTYTVDHEYQAMLDALEEFIEKVEGEGLYE